MVLTKNGAPYVVIVDARDYCALDAEIGLLALLFDAGAGIDDALAGRVLSEREFRKEFKSCRKQ
ncbi:hypothetical protein E5S69_07560 [Cupriavidus necator]|nr:hypothetical protein [Cupriavidus necator]